jgi:16S rRNA (guanine527-N7)-methyltransferase
MEPTSAAKAMRAASGDPSTAAQVARRSLERELAGDPSLAAALPTSALSGLEHYVRLLLAANDRLNLTRILEPESVGILHLLDALVALPYIDELAPAQAVDLGSGGGVPALPLAIARPGVHWTLVESVRRKASALRDFTTELGLENVTILPERAEAVGRDPRHRAQFDLATARACASLPVLVELALPLLVVGATLLAWKGPLRPEDPEVRHGQAAASLLGGGALSILPAGPKALGGRTLVCISKDGPTPERYPRRPGEPARRPLA